MNLRRDERTLQRSPDRDPLEGQFVIHLTADAGLAGRPTSDSCLQGKGVGAGCRPLGCVAQLGAAILTQVRVLMQCRFLARVKRLSRRRGRHATGSALADP